jgi:hypothetical protein
MEKKSDNYDEETHYDDLENEELSGFGVRVLGPEHFGSKFLVMDWNGHMTSGDCDMDCEMDCVKRKAWYTIRSGSGIIVSRTQLVCFGDIREIVELLEDNLRLITEHSSIQQASVMAVLDEILLETL